VSIGATAFLQVRLRAPAPLVPELAEFYCGRVGLGGTEPEANGVAVEVGETMLELLPAAGWPFYHVALLVPGNRFEAVLDWARDRVDLLPNRRTGGTVAFVWIATQGPADAGHGGAWHAA